MNPQDLQSILQRVQTGEISPNDAAGQLRKLPFENLGHSRVDHHRSLRNGYPEVIFGEGKLPAQVVEIAQSLAKNCQTVVVTRATPGQVDAVQDVMPEAIHHVEARMIVLAQSPPPARTGCISVISAGTADMPIAEEAAVTAETMGSNVQRIYDAGVAGLHRLLAELDSLHRSNVIIAVAGMEGALPSVVAGLVGTPVIAVPTSMGYGVNLGGLTTLFAMLTSCSDGLSVVNIDNGFGAACQAHLINRLASKT